MESSIHSIAQYVVAAGIVVGVTALGASMAALGVVMLLSAARNHEREEHPNDASAKGVDVARLFPAEMFAAPQLEPVYLPSQLGERECWLCHEPSSVVGVLGRARAVGATLDSWVCKECFGDIEHRVVQPARLTVVHGDLSDMEIPARVLPFPESASIMKRGSMVS